MTWKIEFDNRARRELRKLDPETQKRLLSWISENMAGTGNPREKGRALKGRFRGVMKIPRWELPDGLPDQRRRNPPTQIEDITQKRHLRLIRLITE